MAEPVHRLDFDGIKANLKNYLRDQEQFSDFNFEGAGMNILLDVLAYNTHYQGFYNNMVASEMFLDTARVRESVVSIAKQLGYVPRSSKAARAVVNVYDTSENPNILSAGTKFTAKLNGKIYNFVTLSDYKFVADSIDDSGNVTKWVAKNVSIYEGTLYQYSYAVDETVKDQRFILPSANIDTTSIEVRVQKSFTDTTGYSKLWTQYNAISGIDETSEVYHVQEAEEKFYEIIFGDGIMGKKVKSGNIIRVVYLVTKGTDEANGIGQNDREGARTFTYVSASGKKTKDNVVVVEASRGGEPMESIRSIKFNAPKFFQSQNRAITADDYETLVRKDFANIDTMAVWGGEDNDPPQFGKVFIAIKPKAGTKLSLEDKVSITNSILKEKTIVGLSVEIADPDITYIKVATNVLYDDSATTLTPSRLERLVTDRIKRYASINLDQFSEPFYYSQFTKDIDLTASSVVSNFTRINLEKRIQPVVGVEANFLLKYENAFHHPHDGHKTIVKSSAFSYNDENGVTYKTCNLRDDGSGTMQISYLLDGKERILIPNIGQIDYEKGTVNLISFAPVAVDNNVLKIQVVPERYDVDTSKRTILSLDENDVSAINVTIEKLSERGIADSVNTSGGVSVGATSSTGTSSTTSSGSSSNASGY